MSHLAPDVLYAVVFDHIPLGAEAEQHLASCAECRCAQAGLAALAGDLALARASEATPAAVERYAALFSEVQQSPGPLTALWRTITAHLTWDSRRQPSLQGVRSGAAPASYRLLYSGDEAEIELLVEGDGSLFRVQGELMARAGAAQDLALVQWFAPDGALVYETEADRSGQFGLRGVHPGRYRLSIVPAAGESREAGGNIEIEALEII